MISYAEACAAIAAIAAPRRIETLELTQALGRIVAEDVRLAGDQPSFDRSTMDGYALVLNRATTSFRVLAVATGWCLGFAVVPWVALATFFR